MSTTNGIELPPIIVTPDPLPPPVVPPIVPGGGYVPRPGTWNKDYVPGTKLTDLGINLYQDSSVVPIIIIATESEQRIKDAYTAYMPNLPAQLDAEINESIAQGGDLSLGGLNAEKALIDNLLQIKMVELEKDTNKANAFFGRGFLDKKPVANGVNFGDRLRKAGDPDVYFDSFNAAATAAYNSLIVAEEIRILTDKSSALSALIGVAKAEEDARIAAEAEAKLLEEEKAKEEEELKGAIKFTADFYKEISAKYGTQMSTLATDLAENAKGKTLRSADEALKAFEQYKDHLDKKFSAADRAAIVNALDSLDSAELAKNLNLFTKGFGAVGKALDVYDLVNEVKKSYASGDWNNTALKVETLFAGSAATGLIAFAFGVTVSTPVGIVAFALIMALVSAYIDDAHLKQFNDALDAILP